MPSLRFANLGTTPGTAEVSVLGNLYVLMTEELTTAIVFDLRRYVTNPPNDEYVIKFRRVGSFEIPILPKSRLKSFGMMHMHHQIPFETVLKAAKRVFVVNLSGQLPATVGWHWLEQLFPKAEISQIPLGRTDWRPVLEEDKDRRAIQAIEATNLVDRGKKVELSPFTLFLFRGRDSSPASILTTGETLGCPFAFFFANRLFRKFFPGDRLKTEPPKMHTLSGGRWNVFFSLPNIPTIPADLFAALPVEELIEQT